MINKMYVVYKNEASSNYTHNLSTVGEIAFEINGEHFVYTIEGFIDAIKTYRENLITPQSELQKQSQRLAREIAKVREELHKEIREARKELHMHERGWQHENG